MVGTLTACTAGSPWAPRTTKKKAEIKNRRWGTSDLLSNDGSIVVHRLWFQFSRVTLTVSSSYVLLTDGQPGTHDIATDPSPPRTRTRVVGRRMRFRRTMPVCCPQLPPPLGFSIRIAICVSASGVGHPWAAMGFVVVMTVGVGPSHSAAAAAAAVTLTHYGQTHTRVCVSRGHGS